MNSTRTESDLISEVFDPDCFQNFSRSDNGESKKIR